MCPHIILGEGGQRLEGALGGTHENLIPQLFAEALPHQHILGVCCVVARWCMKFEAESGFPHAHALYSSSPGDDNHDDCCTAPPRTVSVWALFVCPSTLH